MVRVAAVALLLASCAKRPDPAPLLASARAAQDEADWSRAFADYSAATQQGGGERARWGALLAKDHLVEVRGQGGARDVAFLEDGTALALIAGELRDVATGTARAPAPAGAEFQGPFLLSRAGGVARVLTLDGRLLLSLAVPAAAPLAVAQDGRGFVLYDGGLWVVAIPSGARARISTGPARARLSLGGFMAAVRTDDGTVQVWSTRDRKLVARRTGVGALFAIAPDGSTLAWEDSSGIHLGSVGGVGDRTLGPPVHATRFAFSADGALVAACAADALRIWARHDGVLEEKIPGPASACALSSDSRVALADGRLVALPARTAHPHAPWAIFGLVFPSGTELVTFANDGKVATFDVPSGAEHAGAWVRAPAACGSTVLSMSAGRIAAAGEKRAVLWKHVHRDLTEVLRVEGRFSAAALAAGVLVASAWPASLVAFDARTGNARWHQDTFACTLASNGPVVAVGGRDGTLRLLDAATGALKATLPPLHAPMRALAFSADGKRLAAGADVLVVYSVEDNQAQELSVPLAARAVAFSLDGTLVATGSDDGVVRIFLQGREVATLPPLGAPVSAVAFSPDGAWLATGTSAGGGARLTRLPPENDATPSSRIHSTQ